MYDFAAHPERLVHRLGDNFIVARYESQAGGWYSPVAPADRQRLGYTIIFAGTLAGLGARQFGSRAEAFAFARLTGWLPESDSAS